MNRRTVIIGILAFLLLLAWLLFRTQKQVRKIAELPDKTTSVEEQKISQATTSSTSAKTGVVPPIGPQELARRQQQPRPSAMEWVQSLQTPIQFYGKVIDENDVPIIGAQVVFSVSSTEVFRDKSPEQQQGPLTDEKGCFSITGKSGVALTVSVSKNGYYQLPESSQQFVYAKTLSSYKKEAIPDENNPSLFRLRKAGQPVPLIKIENFIKTPRNGSPVEISLKTGRIVAAGQGDLRVETWTNDQNKDARGRYNWRCVVSVPNGGLIQRQDQFDFTAPAEGYQPSDEISMTQTTEGWNSHAVREYFAKTSNGYARIQFEMAASGDHFFSITSYLNPTSGDRNLEFDVAKQIKAK